MSDLSALYQEAMRQADWYAAAGYIVAAAESELNAMMILACSIAPAREATPEVGS